MRRATGRHAVVLLAVAAVALAIGPNAGANGQPTMKVTKDTTLTSDFAGTVVIAKDGVTLDCAGHQITGNGNGRGISVDKRSGVTVRNCDVSNFSTGFFVASTTHSAFENNRSHDNGLANPNQTPGWISGAGFWMQASSENALIGNDIYNNTSDGLDVLNSANNLFEDNSVEWNLAGIYVLGKQSVGNVLRANTAADNEFDGFAIVDAASSNTLEANVATRNAPGFWITASSDNVLASNVADANRDIGFLVDGGASDNELVDNDAPSNSGCGFVVGGFGTDRNLLERNTAHYNGYCGLLVHDGASDNELDRNTTAFNSQHGFILAVEGTTGNVLRTNYATGGVNGFLIDNKAAGNELIENAAFETAGTGFLLVNGASGNSLLRNAAASSTSGFRILGEGSSDNTLVDNNATANDGSGFVVSDATNNTLSGNTSVNNGLRGFNVIGDGTRDNLFQSNSASGNGAGCTSGQICGGFAIVFGATMNALVGNTADNNTGYGFGLVSATNNTLSGNSASGNSIFDAAQDAASTGNVWTNNTFGTTSGL